MSETKRICVVSLPNIPHEIIIQILERTPAKSLMRFKCVSREWFNTILDPSFADSHAYHARNRPHLLFKLDYDNLRAIFPTTQNLSYSSQLPLYTITRTIPYSNVANGLICVHDSSSNPSEPVIQVLNLTTMQKKVIPAPELIGQFTNSHYFLGFEPVSKKHKILHLGLLRGGPEGVKLCKVLTFGTQTWRPISDDVIPQGHLYQAKSIGGRIYLQMWDMIEGVFNILFFDLIKEEFQHIVVPQGFLIANRSKFYLTNLTEIGGKLAILQQKQFIGSIDFGIWILEEDKIWVKKSFKSLESREGYFIGLIGNNTILFNMDGNTRSDDRGYWLYDLDTWQCTSMGSSLLQSTTLPVDLMARLRSRNYTCCEPFFNNYVENIMPLEYIIKD